MQSRYLFRIFVLATICCQSIASDGSELEKASDLPPPGLVISDDCRKFVEGLPPTVFKRWVAVPEDYAISTSPKIHVFTYGSLPTSGKLPVIFFQGGPAADSWSQYLRLSKMAKFGGMIYMDHRGTGCSSSFPQATSRNFVKDMLLYGGRNIVRDAETVRNVLFGASEKWIIFGQSYGARLVHRYLEMHPANIASAIAYGGPTLSNPKEFYGLRLKASKRLQVKFSESYPESVKALEQFRGSHSEKDCFTGKSGTAICGTEFLDVVLMRYFTFMDFWKDLSEMMINLTKNQESRTKMVSWAADQVPSHGESYYANYVIGGRELGDGGDYEDCEYTHEVLLKESMDPGSILFNECRYYLKYTTPLARSFDDALSADKINLSEIRRGLEKHSGLKLYLFSGELDPMTPPEMFRDEIDALGNLKNFTFMRFEGRGHEGYRSDEVGEILESERGRLK